MPNLGAGRLCQAAVIFDLDGTITRPFLDFDKIRAEIGLENGPILEAVRAMSCEPRKRAEAILERHEWVAAKNATAHDGARDVVEACRNAGFGVAILTRNARAMVEHVLDLLNISVDAIRTREDGFIKPSPEPVWSICRELSARPDESWVVGDFRFDLEAGRSAGTRTILMIGDSGLPEFAHLADHVIRRLPELLPIVGATGN